MPPIFVDRQTAEFRAFYLKLREYEADEDVPQLRSAQYRYTFSFTILRSIRVYGQCHTERTNIPPHIESISDALYLTISFY